MHFRYVQQVVAVAYRTEFGDFLFLRHSRQIVDRAVNQADQILRHLVRERRFREEFLRWVLRRAPTNEAILAINVASEERRRYHPEPFIEAAIDPIGWVTLGNAEVRQDTLCLFSPVRGTDEIRRACVRHECLAFMLEFVPLRMAAEVVMVVDDENLRVVSKAFAKEMGGGQSAKSTPNHDQVV